MKGYAKRRVSGKKAPSKNKRGAKTKARKPHKTSRVRAVRKTRGLRKSRQPVKARKARKPRKVRIRPAVRGKARKSRKDGVAGTRKARRIVRTVRRRRHAARPQALPENPAYPADNAGPPDGVVSTREWMASHYDEAGFQERFKTFYTDDVTLLSDSKTVDEALNFAFRNGMAIGRPSFAAMIEGARVWEKNGAVITPDNKLLSDVSWDYLGGIVYGHDHNAFHQWHQPPLRQVPETAGLLTFIWSGNYFHWLFDVLPRVDLLRRSGIPIDKYIVPKDNQAIQDETLNLLGIPRERRIETDHDFHARFDRLVIPSFVRSERDHPSEYPRWVTDFLRYEFLYTKSMPPAQEYERIYVSRAKAYQRRVLNEDQVIGLLEPRGFRVVCTEELPFAEQVRVFASAKAVVAPHGAGMSNLVFSSPGTKVFELLPPNYVSNYFWHLSNQVGVEHHYLIGRSAVKPHEAWWEGSTDFDVDIGKLDRLLQLAGI